MRATEHTPEVCPRRCKCARESCRRAGADKYCKSRLAGNSILPNAGHDTDGKVYQIQVVISGSRSSSASRSPSPSGTTGWSWPEAQGPSTTVGGQLHARLPPVTEARCATCHNHQKPPYAVSSVTDMHLASRRGGFSGELFGGIWKARTTLAFRQDHLSNVRPSK